MSHAIKNLHRSTTPQVYVACLAAYNAGKLHGEWCDATNEHEILDTIERVIESSPVEDAEEHAFHDYDGFGKAGDALGEYSSAEDVAELAALLETHGADLVGAAVENWGPSTSDIVGTVEDMIENNYHGEYSSVGDYAHDVYEQTGGLDNVPSSLRYHIDWESVGKEMETGGLTALDAPGGGVYIFSE